MHRSSCFADLSHAELAHVRRCQFIAQAEGFSVVSSGVLAAAAGPAPFAAPAGAHFWLVASGISGSFSVVWLAGARLCCGCSRRRAGALTCSHAQAVRLWLLAAAGVSVPVLSSSLGLGAAAPDPDPEPPTPAGPAAVASVPAVAPIAPIAPITPVVVCPACERPASAGVLRDWGVCPECLDLMAAAEGVEKPARCCMCSSLATGETIHGAFCARHLAEEEADRYYELDGELVDSWNARLMDPNPALETVEA